MHRAIITIDLSVIEQFNEEEMLLLNGGMSVEQVMAEAGINGYCPKTNKKNCGCNGTCPKTQGGDGFSGGGHGGGSR